jgi:hypothetical protein
MEKTAYGMAEARVIPAKRPKIRGYTDRCEPNEHHVRAHCQVRQRPVRLIDEIPTSAVVLHNQPLDAVLQCSAAIAHTAAHHGGANRG